MLAKAHPYHSEASANTTEVCAESSNHHPVIGSKTDIQLDSYENPCDDKDGCPTRENVVRMQLGLLA